MSKLPKNLLAKLKMRSRSEVILDHLYNFIEDTMEVGVDEEKSEREIAVEESIALMQAAASFSAHVIREASKLGLDETLLYDDHMELLDIYLDLEEEKELSGDTPKKV